ncbi:MULTISPECIES: rubrerythrin family protein [unclassified Haladaptatus]|uniref:rubrerythrin family protein n=1 Tax=unclassified Haladaptatus TaxID=2622732 RepID=UPI00209C25A9|nr:MULTISPECIES: rubrerythrin family protein [unclassified Haladaptatus]MCO8242688.1 rubrerythrin family protein [Haladaptatus sp. AB643]MCO8252447.1 rubrerythrin family protein [Haladaptatus sp. AB618]
MNSEEFLDAVRKENETALSRLGSSKSLYAATGGEMEPDEVFDAAADSEYAAAQTFGGWADDEGDEDASELFAGIAEVENGHYERVSGKVDDHEPNETPALHEYLRGLDDTIERLGGFVGRTLASEKSKKQLTGFFTGKADPKTAQLFRDLNGDLDEQLNDTLTLLDERCDSDEDWETAKEAAKDAITAAYDEYTESLESMGVNPKPVC